MTNKEFYKDKILELALDHKLFIKTNEGHITSCSDNECRRCIFMKLGRCDDHFKNWLEEEYVEPQVDWSKVEVDTKILVKNRKSEPWQRRYFARYKYGKFFTWSCGGTSWSCDETVSWKYAKLYEDGD